VLELELGQKVALNELAPFQLIELHSVPCAAGAELEDTELAQISQRASVALSLAGWKP
jgi:hypothetical protein